MEEGQPLHKKVTPEQDPHEKMEEGPPSEHAKAPLAQGPRTKFQEDVPPDVQQNCEATGLLSACKGTKPPEAAKEQSHPIAWGNGWPRDAKGGED